MDNNGDLTTDFPDDPGCTSAADDNESGAPDCPGGIPVDEVTYTGMTTGTTTGSSLSDAFCGGATAPEAFAFIDVPVNLTVLSINTFGTVFGDVLYVETICADNTTSLGCATAALNGDGSVATPAVLDVNNVAPGGYFIGIDGMASAMSMSGAYYLHVFGLIAPGEDCVPGDPVFRCDTSLNFECIASVPGGPTRCVAGLCSDGDDNDGDAITDWPFDPGCDDVLDNDETDPASTPECYDATDNDADALTDYPSDPGCEDTADDLELDQCVPGLLVNNLTASGNVIGSTSGTGYLTASCDTSFMGSGPEAVYLLQVPAIADVTASTANPGTSFNTFVSIRDVCDDAATEVGCGSGGTLGDTATATGLLPGSYFIIIDGTDLAAGSFELSVSGTLAAGQPCDPSWLRFSCEATTACEVSVGSPTGMACVLADCADGTDNDGDAVPDYPGDPGCTSLSDASEVDPATLPQCANGVDDDADALTDWPADTGCSAASDDDETCTVFGTDTYGYIGCSDFPAVMPCDDISATGTAIAGTIGDDGTTVISIPFTFDFYGTGSSSPGIASNGKIGFPVGGSLGDVCLGSAFETNTIFAYWDDLYPPTGNVRWEVLGTSPNRRLVVQWVVQHYSSSPGTIDVRAMLFEGTNDITVCYNDTTFGTAADNGASATAGIRGTGSDFVQWSCAPTATITTGLVLNYFHP
jgi:hypothetical protein